MMIFKQNVRIMSCYFLTFKFLLKTYFKLIGLFRFWNLALCNYSVAVEAVRSILKLISNPDLSRPGQGTDLNFQNKMNFLKVLNFSFPVPIVGPCMKDVYHLQRAKIYRRNFPPVGFIQSRTVLLIRRQSNPITPHVMWLELFWSKLSCVRDDTRDREENGSRQNDVSWCDFLRGKQIEFPLCRSLLPKKTQKICRPCFALGEKYRTCRQV